MIAVAMFVYAVSNILVDHHPYVHGVAAVIASARWAWSMGRSA